MGDHRRRDLWTYLGNLLTGQLGVRRDDVRVLDPNHAPIGEMAL